MFDSKTFSASEKTYHKAIKHLLKWYFLAMIEEIVIGNIKRVLYLYRFACINLSLHFRTFGVQFVHRKNRYRKESNCQ